MENLDRDYFDEFQTTFGVDHKTVTVALTTFVTQGMTIEEAVDKLRQLLILIQCVVIKEMIIMLEKVDNED